MSFMGVRNLAGFNQKSPKPQQGEKNRQSVQPHARRSRTFGKLPFIVVVVDEFADLMMTAGKKIEELIARLAQKPARQASTLSLPHNAPASMSSRV